MSIEFDILNAIQTIHTPFLDKLMCGITRLGNMGIVWIALAILLLIYPKKSKTAIILLTALVIDTLLCNVLLKNVFCRIRPFDVNTAVQLLVAKPRDFSFPSGHTAISFAAVSALYYSKEKWLWKGAALLAVLIAFSRLYLYVHYPTDILGGIVTGWIAGYAAWRITRIFQEHKKEPAGQS